MDHSSTNRVFLIGRLGQNPEMKTITSGKSLVTISVATSEKFKNNKGENIEKTEWHRCVCWGQTADFVGKYLKKGSLVYLDGKLQTRKWQDKDGNDRYTTEIQVKQITSLGSKNDNPQKIDSEEDDMPDFLRDLNSSKSNATNDIPDNKQDYPF